MDQLRSTLEGQLVLELLRTGRVSALFKDPGGNLVLISQLDVVVQFWAILKVEPFGNEIRVSERTGYEWWIPWTAQTRILGLPMRQRLIRVESSLGEWGDLGWPYSGFFSKPAAVAFCSVLALALFPLGPALWASHAYLRARHRKRFCAWNDPCLSDSLDLALLSNERGIPTKAGFGWRVESIVKEDGMPAYPDIAGRIDVMRELVGAAVTQAIEETINSQPLAAAGR